MDPTAAVAPHNLRLLEALEAVPAPASLGEVGRMRVMSDLLSRFDLAGRAGLTFGGKRDIYRQAGYKTTLEPKDYRARYERLGIAARLVELFPKATWRGGFDIVEDPDPKTTTPFEAAWTEMSKRLDAPSAFERADILCGLGRYSVILIGAPGKLFEPLDKLRPDEVMYLFPFSEEDVTWRKEDLEKDTAVARYGRPDIYRFGRLTDGKINRARRVHWSRVIHIACDVLDEPNFGKPTLRPGWNDFDDLEKIRAGGAEAHWSRADPGIKITVDDDTVLDAVAEQELDDEIDQYRNRLTRVLRMRGADAEMLDTPVAAIGPNLEAIVKLIAIGGAVPMRIFAGSERGELASTQDRSNYNENVSARRTSFAAPVVVRPFVDRMIEFEALPKPPQGYEVEWFESENLDELEKADVAVKLTTANKTHMEATGMPLLTGDEIRTITLGLPPLADVMTVVVETAQTILRRARRFFLRRRSRR